MTVPAVYLKPDAIITEHGEAVEIVDAATEDLLAFRQARLVQAKALLADLEAAVDRELLRRVQATGNLTLVVDGVTLRDRAESKAPQQRTAYALRARLMELAVEQPGSVTQEAIDNALTLRMVERLTPSVAALHRLEENTTNDDVRRVLSEMVPRRRRVLEVKG